MSAVTKNNAKLGKQNSKNPRLLWKWVVGPGLTRNRMIQNEGNDSRKLFTLKIALCR